MVVPKRSLRSMRAGFQVDSITEPVTFASVDEEEEEDGTGLARYVALDFRIREEEEEETRRSIETIES